MWNTRRVLMFVLCCAAVLGGSSGAARGGAVTLTAGDATGAEGASIWVDIAITSLDLGGLSGVDSVTLSFVPSDPALVVGGFTPGPLLAGWLDLTTRPPYPASAWNYVNFAAADIAGLGLLGTVEVSSATAGLYTLGFDVTTPGIGSEVVGVGGTVFGITADSASVSVVPEPATLSLVGLGLLALARARSRRQ